MKVCSVVGARPNFVKLAPLARELSRRPQFKHIIIHTGQHYDASLADAFFSDLGIPPPGHALGIGSGTATTQTARTMLALEPILRDQRPDWVVVVGDVNATLAATLTAVQCGLRTAHVEAGLRSHDRTMPEEINRRLVDAVADLLLTPSADADDNLQREGVPPERIRRVGNVMVDSLLWALPHAAQSPILSHLGLTAGAYAVATLHRPSNVDDPATLQGLVWALAQLAQRLPVVFPVHPRTQARLDGLALPKTPRLRYLPPLGYLDFLQLWRQARLVLTDSGGLQEETTVLGIPCLTLRATTERPITVWEGTNRIVGTAPDAILSAAEHILTQPYPVASRRPDLWDGRTAERIVDALLEAC
ncbi:MAG: UDP-N-acetylglucosamine 2-epimerase (non-hydrolyzing) [Chloracidobacterium sp.]|uniref:UDP-N-acetylglucosamine 2-epimerase (Non-hydrolyzing) n=1 Tax=Chloracidobacterium validum TaxID=2821543 RepID=A0ABX8BAU8_9BACT|nr:UDP-N-acetylglucosamine 2-epimerase (non-hydrolyzing) [Chloracidobacterium validum]QUW02758.1 UDP-N-acetylglucosamine 2-epimerase (non-hydrolyzing) [Chloracidobacterium validum]